MPDGRRLSEPPAGEHPAAPGRRPVHPQLHQGRPAGLDVRIGPGDPGRGPEHPPELVRRHPGGRGRPDRGNRRQEPRPDDRDGPPDAHAPHHDVPAVAVLVARPAVPPARHVAQPGPGHVGGGVPGGRRGGGGGRPGASGGRDAVLPVAGGGGMTGGPAHPVRASRGAGRRTLVYAILLALLVACVVYPLRQYVVEPRRQLLLGHHETPGRRLAIASEFGFGVAGGQSVRIVPGEAVRDLSDLPTETATLVLGGFRGPYVVWLWMNTQDEKQKKVHFNLIDRYRQIAALQSDYPQVWTFLAWDLGWNESVQWQSQEQRYQWIRRAIEFLREGVAQEPQQRRDPGEHGLDLLRETRPRPGIAVLPQAHQGG